MRQRIALLTVVVSFACCSTNAQMKMRTLAGPMAPPRLTIESEFIDASGDRILASEEYGTLTVKVANRGGEAHKVTVRARPLVPVAGLVIDSSAAFAKVASGQTVEVQFIVWAGEDVPTEKAALLVEADDESNAGFASARTDIALSQSLAPNLVLGRVFLNGRQLQAGGNAATPGRRASVTLEIVNNGERKARGVVVAPTIDAPFVLLDSSHRFELGDLDPRSKESISISLQVSDRIKSEAITVKVQISEQHRKFSREHEVRIPLRKIQSGKR